MYEAAYWHSTTDSAVVCDLCPTGCTLRAGRDGPCRTRARQINHSGYTHFSQIGLMRCHCFSQ